MKKTATNTTPATVTPAQETPIVTPFIMRADEFSTMQRACRHAVKLDKLNRAIDTAKESADSAKIERAEKAFADFAATLNEQDTANIERFNALPDIDRALLYLLSGYIGYFNAIMGVDNAVIACLSRINRSTGAHAMDSMKVLVTVLQKMCAESANNPFTSGIFGGNPAKFKVSETITAGYRALDENGRKVFATEKNITLTTAILLASQRGTFRHMRGQVVYEYATTAQFYTNVMRLVLAMVKASDYQLAHPTKADK